MRYSYNASIGACEKSVEWEGSLALLWEMINQLLTLDVITYSAEIKALGNGNKWEGTLVLL